MYNWKSSNVLVTDRIGWYLEIGLYRYIIVESIISYNYSLQSLTTMTTINGIDSRIQHPMFWAHWSSGSTGEAFLIRGRSLPARRKLGVGKTGELVPTIHFGSFWQGSKSTKNRSFAEAKKGSTAKQVPILIQLAERFSESTSPVSESLSQN